MLMTDQVCFVAVLLLNDVFLHSFPSSAWRPCSFLDDLVQDEKVENLNYMLYLLKDI